MRQQALYYTDHCKSTLVQYMSSAIYVMLSFYNIKAFLTVQNVIPWGPLEQFM